MVEHQIDTWKINDRINPIEKQGITKDLLVSSLTSSSIAVEKLLDKGRIKKFIWHLGTEE